MASALDKLQMDMPVYSSDGDTIGKAYGIGLAESGETSPGHITPAIGPHRYLRVVRELAEDLWIPDDQVLSVEIGQGVQLNCTAEECARLYMGRPAEVL